MTGDGKTILCADKFGDVYALPLLPVPLLERPMSTAEAGNEPQQQWKPSATPLTVHTERNRAALRNQQQDALQKQAERKKINSHHQLLLGHVSLVTDVASVSLRTSEGDREYIVTADRDEHIRVSRGPKQAHIIERFCLGHTQFVSRICVPKWRPNMLISGGGDDYLIAWEWANGTIKQKIDIRSEWQRVRDRYQVSHKESGNNADAPVAVSGIWAMEQDAGSGIVLVACQCFPALLSFRLNATGQITAIETLELSHNVLDVTVNEKEQSVMCSLDTVHAICTQSLVEEAPSQGPLVDITKFSQTEQKWETTEPEVAEAINNWAGGQGGVDLTRLAWLGDLYYGIEDLRKQNVEDEISRE